MKRSKRPPPPEVIGVFWQRVRDDITKSDITVAGTVTAYADGTLRPHWELRVGPGLGPHHFEDLALGHRVAWALHHCVDALNAYTGQPDPEQDPQMTLEDAPLTDGHPATIRVGGHR